MNGETLYNIYCELDGKLNSCDNEDWDDLDSGTQDVWDALADRWDTAVATGEGE